MLRLAVLSAGGVLGTILRYELSSLTYRLTGNGFPYGTLLVNSVGCLLIGFLGTFMEEKVFFSPAIRSFLFIGFLGAFTTYSTFSYETWKLVKGGETLFALTNLIGHITIGFTLLIAGVSLARWIA